MSTRALGVLIVAVAVLLSVCCYTVNQSEKAILFSFGEIRQANISPGLHFKLPPPLNTIRKFDGRIQSLDSLPERYLTIEKKNVMVDFFVKWRISDVGQYYRSTGGDELRTHSRLSQIIKDGLRNEFGKRTIQEAVSGERSDIMGTLKMKSNESVGDLGIKVIDVRVSRIDLPDEVSTSVYERMRAERDRVAKDFRARGMETAERIRATSDKERTVILANAYRDAQLMRGEGDAKSSEIYAKAYQQNPEFYAFTRSLKAYEAAFSGKGDVLVLDPDSDFFRYFKQPGGKAHN
jgi:membrane protease subunit HflC